MVQTYSKLVRNLAPQKQDFKPKKKNVSNPAHKWISYMTHKKSVSYLALLKKSGVKNGSISKRTNGNI